MAQVKLTIHEEVSYEVVSDTVYNAMDLFLTDPSKYLTAVDERYYYIDDRTLTDEEYLEIERAENNA
jgi:hypothetical protein